MNKKYFYTILLSLLFTNLLARSMEFTSCKTYVKVEKNLEKGLEFGLQALDIEPENSLMFKVSIFPFADISSPLFNK